MTGDLTFFDDMLSDAGIAAELERRRHSVSARAAQAVAATVPALAWRLGDGMFATPLAEIYGVSGPVRTTTVPGAPAGLIGVFARRGVIHTLFDPARALGARAAEDGAGAVILLRQDRPRIAIRVAGATGVIDLPGDHGADAAPGGEVARILVLADGRAVCIVDTGRLIGHLTGQTLLLSPEG